MIYPAVKIKPISIPAIAPSLLSLFENIPGIGKNRIKKLWQEFNSIEEIKNTKVKNIQKQTGIPKKLCEAILTYSQGIKN